jgi:hypothetical protein
MLPFWLPPLILFDGILESLVFYFLTHQNRTGDERMAITDIAAAELLTVI